MTETPGVRDGRAGRPPASSRATLSEAACELFLERGYEATTVADITTRAGVSRSSFFNYFASKSAVLWSSLDERIETLETELAEAQGVDAVAGAVTRLAAGFAPDSLALAVGHASAMGVVDELAHEGALRAARIARAVAPALERGGASRLASEVRGAAWGGAVLAAVRAWASAGAGRSDLAASVHEAALIARGA